MNEPARDRGFVLGVRAEPRGLEWAVVEGTRTRPILHGHGKETAPVSFAEPAALSWVRQRALDLISTYRPVAVGIRYPERYGPARSSDAARQRSRIEGVVLEAVNSRGLPVLTGPLGTIAARLRTKAAKKYVDAPTMRGLDLSTISKARREAVLIAVAQLPEDATPP